MTTTPTLTERARRILADCKSFDVVLPIAIRFLIRDLLAENAKLRAHAEAMAKRADEVIDQTYCVPLSDELTTDDANELHNDLVNAVEAFRAAFPENADE